MNAANESSPAPSLRRLPFSVRLAPHFVNCLAAVLPEEHDESEKIEGLLFGMVEAGFSVLRMFHLSSPIPGLGRQANFEEVLTRSRKNPQLAGFTLLGWFAVRNDEGLQADDIAFHEQNFRKANDIALIVKVEPEGELSLELFCAGVDGTFTDGSRRSGTVRVSSVSPVISPLEVPMELHRDVHVPNGPVEPEVEEDDPIAFLREAFASGARKAIDVVKTPKPEGREDVPIPNGAVDVTATRNVGSSTSSAPGSPFATSGGAAAAPARIPPEAPQAAEPGAHDREKDKSRNRGAESPIGRDASREIPAVSARADAVLVRSEDHRSAPAAHHLSFNPKPELPQREPFAAQSNAAPVPVPAPAFGLEPAHSGPLSRFSTQAIPALPWRKLALIFVLVAGATFGFVYLRTAHANGTLPQFVQAVWPAPGLDLKIAANGDRFQLSWNRNLPAVRNAREAVLDINDGPSRHQILLGNSELANGSVLYLPSSDDVMFRLQVHGAAGQKATESLRVIGTAKSSVLEVSRPNDTSTTGSEPPARTVASRRSPNENAKTATASRRPPAAAKPERGRSDDTRQSTTGTAAAPVGNEALAKADVPRVPSPSSGPGPDRALEAAHPSPSSPAANTAVANPPQTNAAPGREAQTPPQSNSSAPSSAQKPNTTETAQLSKPDEPIVSADNNAGKTAPLQQPAPSPVQPAKPDTAAAQPAVTYNPPRPLKQVLPKITALPPGVAENAGEVRVAVRVDESGRVIDARLVEGKNRVSSMLATASLTAARQWIFEPASLRGKNVASDHTIVFQFRH